MTIKQIRSISGLSQLTALHRHKALAGSQKQDSINIGTRGKPQADPLYITIRPFREFYR